MTVYDALEKRHRMPRAWEDWADYRAQWSRWVIRCCERNRSILIVGAGACNDYDLAEFCSFFEKIYLLDLDVAFMEEGLKRISPEHRGRIELLSGDFLGILPGEYRDFCHAVQAEVNHRGKNTDIRELADMALVLVEKLYEAAGKRGEKLILPCADYVAVSGVHSQINHMLPWIWDAYMQALGQREETVFRRISTENSRIMREMNDRLLAAAARRLFVCAEKSRVGVPGAVEGAWQALEDLKRRPDGKSLLLTDTRMFLWGYDLRQHMIYEMEGLVFTTGSAQK